MPEHEFNAVALYQVLQKLQDDWWENFREFRVLSQWAEVVSIDPESLTRVIKSHLYLLPENDYFDFARNIPKAIVTEECVWTLTWNDQAQFDDPRGFAESDYDSANIEIGSLRWDDAELPEDVFENAMALIDWYATGEWLEDCELDDDLGVSDVPDKLRPYLENALVRHRRQTLGRNGYVKYLLTHPRLLWRRIRYRKLWARLEKEQFASFPSERH